MENHHIIKTLFETAENNVITKTLIEIDIQVKFDMNIY